MIEELSCDSLRDLSFKEENISEVDSTLSKKKKANKKIKGKINSKEIFDENKSNEGSDEDDDDRELLRIGTKTVKKIGVMSKTKKIQKIDFNVFDFLLGWRKNYNKFIHPNDIQTYKIIQTKDIATVKLDDYAQLIQALYINIIWKTRDHLAGKTVEDLKNIDLTTKLINNGIIFIWSEKELINDIVNILEAKNFIYIENFAVILINSKKVNLENDSNTSNKENVEPKKLKSSNSKITSFFKVQPKKDLIQNETNSSLKNKNELTNGKSTIKKSDKVEEEDFHNLSNYDPISLFENQESDFFYKSKKVLLMFRRNEKNSQALELRHQRTSDVVFDLINKDTEWKIQQYVYKMIETLLPKATFETNSYKNFKMMELYADENMPRKGWISICENQT